MGVILNKIDGKTVCGKVVTSFGRFLGADEYIVVNDTIMNDDAQMALMNMSITGGADFDVVKCSTYAKIFADKDYYGTKTIIVFRYVQDVIACMEQGVEIKELNCAGIYKENKENATVYAKNLVCTPEEVELLKSLHNKGVHLVYQPTVQEKVEEVKDLIGF